MKLLPLALGLCLVARCFGGEAPAPVPPASNPAALRWYTQLKLHYLPKESGFLGIIGQSDQTVDVRGKPIPVQGQVYYMLTRELPANYLHHLESDDTQILIEGGPVDYFVFHPDGSVEKFTMGRDVEHGQVLVIPVHGGCWKALRLHPGVDYVLLANCLSPDWTPDRVRIGENDAWVARYAGRAPWATEAFLRELIGPNARAD
jgi:uncharacterized protein